MKKKPEEIYFLSDTHIGGDNTLNKFEAESELVQFLNYLFKRAESKDIELIIDGDFLGLWDIKEKEGINKFFFIEKTHPRLFKAIKKASQHVKISLVPGNHDHELACIKEYPKILKKRGIGLTQKYYLERNFHGKSVWIEHGNRFDPFQRIERFGDLNDTPYGYHILRETISKIIKASERNKKHKTWLADIVFIHPIETIPYWFLSNYFYRELGPILRYILAPFLVFFTLSALLLILAIATRLNIVNIPDIFDFTGYLGPAKYVANAILIFNFIFLVFFVLASLTLKIMRRDFRKSLKNYGLESRKKIRVVDQANYRRGARAFFKKNPRFDLFIYGNNHKASLGELKIGGRIKITANPGTWNKTFFPIKSWFRLPSVYIPCYKLSYLVLKKKKGEVVLSLKFWPKKTKLKLTLLERFSIMFKNSKVKYKRKSVTL